MATNQKYSVLGTFTTAIDGSTTAPTLKNLANNGRKIGNAIDLTGSGNRFTLSNWQLLVRTATAPAANSPVELYFVISADSTNYEYGSDSADPPPTTLVGVFHLNASSDAVGGNKIALKNIILPNAVFKPLIINKSGVAFTNTDAENILSYRTFNFENV